MGTPIEQADAVFQLIALVTDPAAAKARLEELTQAAAHHEAMAQDAESKRAALLAEREAQAAELARQRDEHAQQIAAERAAFEFECARAEQNIHIRRNEAAAPAST